MFKSYHSNPEWTNHEMYRNVQKCEIFGGFPFYGGIPPVVPPVVIHFSMDFRQAERILALPICDSRPVAGYIAGPMEVEERNHGFPRYV